MRRGLVVIVGIGKVLELSGHKRGGIAGHQFLRPADGSLHALGVGSADHLGAQGPHDDHFFLRKILRHKQPHFVAAIHANQRQANAGVPRGCLDNGATGDQLPLPLGAPDDPDSGPVFHAAARIQVLQFRKHVC